MATMPVSSQVYIPNPLTGVRAAQAGFEIGKQSNTFANVVSGVFQGAETATNLIDKWQMMEDRRMQSEFEYGEGAQKEREAESIRQDRTVEQKDRDLAREERHQEYLEDKLDLDEGFRRDQLAFNYHKEDRQDRRTLLRHGLAQAEAAEKNRFETVSTNYLMSGDVSGLLGEFGGGKTAQENAARKARYVAWAMKDSDFGPALLKQTQRALSDSNLSSEHRESLDELYSALNSAPKIAKGAGTADIGGNMLQKHFGVMLDDDVRQVRIYKSKNGDKLTLATVDAQGKEERRSTIFEDDKKAINEVFQSAAAVNDYFRQQEKLKQKAIESATKNKVQLRQQNQPRGALSDGGGEDPTAERPAKQNTRVRTPALRAGAFSVRVPSEKAIIDETEGQATAQKPDLKNSQAAQKLRGLAAGENRTLGAVGERLYRSLPKR